MYVVSFHLKNITFFTPLGIYNPLNSMIKNPYTIIINK